MRQQATCSFLGVRWDAKVSQFRNQDLVHKRRVAVLLGKRDGSGWLDVHCTYEPKQVHSFVSTRTRQYAAALLWAHFAFDAMGNLHHVYGRAF